MGRGSFFLGRLPVFLLMRYFRSFFILIGLLPFETFFSSRYTTPLLECSLVGPLLSGRSFFSFRVLPNELADVCLGTGGCLCVPARGEVSRLLLLERILKFLAEGCRSRAFFCRSGCRMAQRDRCRIITAIQIQNNKHINPITAIDASSRIAPLPPSLAVSTLLYWRGRVVLHPDWRGSLGWGHRGVSVWR